MTVHIWCDASKINCITYLTPSAAWCTHHQTRTNTTEKVNYVLSDHDSRITPTIWIFILIASSHCLHQCVSNDHYVFSDVWAIEKTSWYCIWSRNALTWGPQRVKIRWRKERRRTWRIVFAFSKIAATLRFVLGPVWMLGRVATAGFRLTDCINKPKIIKLLIKFLCVR